MERTRVTAKEKQEEEVPVAEEKQAVVIETNPDEVKMRWKKIGGGSLRLGNRIIKPGQIFVAAPKDIPKAFRDLIISVGGAYDFKKDAPVVPPPVVGIKPTFSLKLRGGSTYLYDVVDAQGKVINSKGLKKELAEQLINDLSK